MQKTHGANTKAKTGPDQFIIELGNEGLFSQHNVCLALEQLQQMVDRHLHTTQDMRHHGI